MNVFIGIDPGTTGAIAVLGPQAEVLFVSNTPTIHTLKTGVEKVISQLDYTPYACVEKVGAFPGQGVVSTFSFGFIAGAAHGILIAYNVPFLTVVPQKWQQGILPKGLELSERKEASIEAAKTRYRDAAKYLTRKKDHGRADAMHLAAYARTYYSLL